eukprot:9503843-Pyramimonas_sp.AAC.2
MALVHAAPPVLDLSMDGLVPHRVHQCARVQAPENGHVLRVEKVRARALQVLQHGHPLQILAGQRLRVRLRDAPEGPDVLAHAGKRLLEVGLPLGIGECPAQPHAVPLGDAHGLAVVDLPIRRRWLLEFLVQLQDSPR